MHDPTEDRFIYLRGDCPVAQRARELHAVGFEHKFDGSPPKRITQLSFFGQGRRECFRLDDLVLTQKEQELKQLNNALRSHRRSVEFLYRSSVSPTHYGFFSAIHKLLDPKSYQNTKKLYEDATPLLRELDQQADALFNEMFHARAHGLVIVEYNPLVAVQAYELMETAVSYARAVRSLFGIEEPIPHNAA